VWITFRNSRGGRILVLACSLAGTAACNNGSATLIQAPSSNTPTGPVLPSVQITGVIPSSGATLLYSVNFAVSAGNACGTGLLTGGALILNDGSVLDSHDATGTSGFAGGAIDPNCSVSGLAAAANPQRLPTLDNVLHVTAVAVYMSPPVGTDAGASYGALSSAVASARYPTDLYMVAQPFGVTSAAGASVGGHWVGTLQDTSSGAGSLDLTLVQQFNSVHGTWTFAFGRTSTTGSVVGYVFGDDVTLMLTPSNAACPLVFRMNAAGAQPLAATYAPAQGCALLGTGSASIGLR
jgi:hypothetical protein